jgi:hypothetical protein
MKDEFIDCSRCKKNFHKKELFLMPEKDKGGNEIWVCYACWNMLA